MQLQTLPKDGTRRRGGAGGEVATRQSQGAPDVGALDSDDFSSLDPGNYVIYSGVFDAQAGRRRRCGG